MGEREKLERRDERVRREGNGERREDKVCVVHFRPCCQVWRLGPLDLTH